MINLMTPCRNIATELKLSFTTLCAILFLTSLLTKAVVAQESFDAYPVLESPSATFVEISPSATFVEMQAGQSVLESSGALDLAEDPNVPDDLNVLTRGPLHEAFASAHQADPQSSALVLKTPPELIDEVPPEYKPDGNSVQWISGYWAWDDAQSDFIWISGIWRDVPPNRRWIPGYWDAEGDGHRWISGIWAEETQLELGYLPEPPASLEQGPSATAPGEDYFYVPGNWTHQGDNYQWNTGHWQPLVENWIWIAASYVWTPNGCVYQSGYWDYEIHNRGTCFAPVQFTQPVYLANNYSYRPSYALNLNVDFLTHLFVRPRCGHYFYGDWYASNFNNVQYRPWVSYSSHFRSYDPLLAYYRHRRSSFDSRYNVVQYVSRQHNFYVNNRDYRPRPTYRSQNSHANKLKHLHATGSKGSKGQRRPHDDFLRKSTYVRSYKDLRTHDDRGRGQSFDGRNRGNQQIKFKHHHKVADKELRDTRRNVDQLAKAQRERKRKEHAGRQPSGNQVIVRKPSAKMPTQNGPSALQRTLEQQRRAKERARQATADANRRQRDVAQSTSRKPSQKPSQKPTIVNRTTDRRPSDPIGDLTKLRSTQPDRRSQSTRNVQRDTAQLADQQKQARQRNDRDAARRSAQQDQARRSQNDQARRSQNDQARRSQNDQARKAQQDLARKATQQSQRDAARKAQQDQAQRAQQDQVRRAQQDQARRTQQDQARRAQQESDRRAQEQVKRFLQQQKQSNTSPNVSGKMRMQNIPSRDIRAQAARQDQRDRTRNAAQQSQQDAARRAQQKAQQAQAQRARQDQARRSQQAAANRAQQDQTRRNQQAAADRARQDQARRSQQRAQQQRSQQQAAQRAKQQQAQRDAAKRAQQQSQRDAAKRAQASRQKSAQKKQKAPAQQSKASRLRNRNSSKK